MMFKKLNVENYEIIRKELLNFSKDSVKEKIRFWDIPFKEFKKCPNFYNFIITNSKMPIRLCRFYLTPPTEILGPHIDGLKNNRSPLGLNFPIIFDKNSSMTWYSCPEDNLIDGNYGFNKITACKILDLTKLKIITKTVIDKPTFVRQDYVHEINNFGTNTRLVLSIRWFYTKTKGQNFNDIFYTENFSKNSL